MVQRLVALAILGIAIYYAITAGLPWLKERMGDSGAVGPGGDSPSHLCVAEASRASDTIADEVIPNARPPVDTAVWGTVLMRAGGALARAEEACSCPTAACGRGYDAVRELRAMFDELDDMARGNPAGFGNPARRQERVYDLLDEARSLARAE